MVIQDKLVTELLGDDFLIESIVPFTLETLVNEASQNLKLKFSTSSQTKDERFKAIVKNSLARATNLRKLILICELTKEVLEIVGKYCREN